MSTTEIANQPASSALELRVGYAAWIALCLVFVTTIMVVGFETASHFAGSAIDGAFQLLNGLRRIEGGFRPGVDFQYFHGLGIPYLHYPLYRLFGGGLHGSELAREMVTTTIYPVVFLVVFRAFLGEWRIAFCLTAAALAASFALNLSAVLFALNGMLGLRSALPTLIPAALYLISSRRWRTIVVGLALGVSLFVSTEQGLAALLAYVAVSALGVARRGDRRSEVLEAAGTVVIAIATLAACLLAIGGVAGMRGALRYNFSLVPMDQYWFFGAPPNVFVPSWKNAVRMSIALGKIGSALVLGTTAVGLYVYRFWRAPEGESGRRNFSLAILTVYGLLSCASLLGVFVPVYVQPCWRGLLIVGLLELVRVADVSDARSGQRAWLGVPRIVAIVTVAVSAWTALTVSLIPVVLTDSLAHVIRDHLLGDARFSVYGIWPQTLADAQRAINTHRGSDGAPPTLWSTYAGWIEARNGIFHPSFDYIIQALGPENRQAYVDRFRATRPQLVQTVLPTYTQYESWIENNEWGFYDELLRWYTVSSTTPWSIFWERRASPGPEAQPFGTMIVPPGMTSAQLPPVPKELSSAVTLLEVEVEYDSRNPLHWLPIIGRSPRYLIGIGGAVSSIPVSLNPFVKRLRFPIAVRAGQRPTLFFRTFSLLPGASWTPRSLRVWVRPIDGRNQVWLSSLVDRFTQGTQE